MQRRSWAVDFADAEIAGGRGWPFPAMRCWGRRIVKRMRDVDQRAEVEEVEGGFKFKLSGGLHIIYRHAASLPGLAHPLEGGALKEQLILLTKPEGSLWEFDIEVPRGLVFAYQDELSPQEIDEGCERPPEIVGSYAVFGPYGEKLGHLYRPVAEDADGRRRWLALAAQRVSPTLARVRIAAPQDWLEAARYPVTIDPTFGYTSIGGTLGDWQTGTEVWAFGPHSPASSGNAQSVSFYVQVGGGAQFTLGIYADSSGYPGSLLRDTAGGTTTASAWNTLDLDSLLAVTQGTDYWLGMMEDAAVRGAYDSAAGFSAKFKAGQTYSQGSLVDPFPSGAITLSDRKYSVYATYTQAGRTTRNTRQTMNVQPGVGFQRQRRGF